LLPGSPRREFRCGIRAYRKASACQFSRRAAWKKKFSEVARLEKFEIFRKWENYSGRYSFETQNHSTHAMVFSDRERKTPRRLKSREAFILSLVLISAEQVRN
jgi:hypothetical protein